MNFRPSPRIVFMGTPEFAVASLDALWGAGFNIVAVITAPDKPGGRGMQLQQSAVKKHVLEKNIPVLQPEKLKNPQFLEELKGFKADIQVVVAFRMLPELVWNMPPMGTINLHGSLLPQYRGAAPINWAIINGETETGVTTFKLQHEIDTGNILLQKTIPVSETDTAGTLHDTMKEAGAQLLVRTIMGLVEGKIEEQGQTTNDEKQTADVHQTTNGDQTIITLENTKMSGTHPASKNSDLSSVVYRPSSLRHAPKIFTETCRIDWSQPCDTVYNLIRGLSPFPGAFTYLNEKVLKIYFSQRELMAHAAEIGSYQTDGETFLKFACADGFIHATDIQPEGKRRMKVEEFLRGFRG